MNIGFIDLHLDEWHANNYPAWIEALGTDAKVAYAWGESDSPTGKTNAEWCEAFGVTLCATVEEVCEKSDALLILAPSNPEVHLRYAEAVLPFGKPTYIDKTFAPDRETARKIFALAEKSHTPVFSTSALRYATEAEGDCAEVLVTGGGRSAEEYIVHQAELLEVMMRAEAHSITAHKAANGTLFSVTYKDGRSAAMLYGEKLPFALHKTDAEGKTAYLPVKSPYFQTLMAEIVRFFQCGLPPVSAASTLRVMALRDGVLKAMAYPNTEVVL